MQLSFSSAIILAAFSTAVTPVAAQSCSAAARFGVINVTPSTLSPGDTFTVAANFTCAAQLGVQPQYIDYYIEVPVNNTGYEPPILLARRTLSSGSLLDQFTTQLPYASFFAGSSYVVMLDTTYPEIGTDGSSYYSVVGGVEHPISLTNI